MMVILTALGSLVSSTIKHYSGFIMKILSFFTNSLFGVDFQLGKVGLSLNFFTEYFDGWEE